MYDITTEIKEPYATAGIWQAVSKMQEVIGKQGENVLQDGHKMATVHFRKLESLANLNTWKSYSSKVEKECCTHCTQIQ